MLRKHGIHLTSYQRLQKRLDAVNTRAYTNYIEMNEIT